MKRRLKSDPEFLEAVRARAAKAARSPATNRARSERAKRLRLWEKGLPAANAPEVRARAAKATSATKLAWCPPHLRDQYRELLCKKRIKAAEAREMILAQDRAEVERLRNRMGYEEPVETAPAPMGRPQVWPDCPEKLRPEYNRLRKRGMKAADARRKLESRIAAAG